MKKLSLYYSPVKSTVPGKKNSLDGIRLFFLVMLLSGQLAGSPVLASDRMLQNSRHQMVRVFEVRDILDGAHPYVRTFLSGALEKDGNRYVFDLNGTDKPFRIVSYQEIEMKVPKGIRTAFPLNFYDERCKSVAVGEVFSLSIGFVALFSEYIQQLQWFITEPALRQFHAAYALEQLKRHISDFSA